MAHRPTFAAVGFVETQGTADCLGRRGLNLLALLPDIRETLRVCDEQVALDPTQPDIARLTRLAGTWVVGVLQDCQQHSRFHALGALGEHHANSQLSSALLEQLLGRALERALDEGGAGPSAEEVAALTRTHERCVTFNREKRSMVDEISAGTRKACAAIRAVVERAAALGASSSSVEGHAEHGAAAAAAADGTARGGGTQGASSGSGLWLSQFNLSRCLGKCRDRASFELEHARTSQTALHQDSPAAYEYVYTSGSSGGGGGDGGDGDEGEALATISGAYGDEGRTSTATALSRTGTAPDTALMDEMDEIMDIASFDPFDIMGESGRGRDKGGDRAGDTPRDRAMGRAGGRGRGRDGDSDGDCERGDRGTGGGGLGAWTHDDKGESDEEGEDPLASDCGDALVEYRLRDAAVRKLLMAELERHHSTGARLHTQGEILGEEERAVVEVHEEAAACLTVDGLVRYHSVIMEHVVAVGEAADREYDDLQLLKRSLKQRIAQHETHLSMACPSLSSSDEDSDAGSDAGSGENEDAHEHTGELDHGHTADEDGEREGEGKYSTGNVADSGDGGSEGLQGVFDDARGALTTPAELFEETRGGDDGVRSTLAAATIRTSSRHERRGRASDSSLDSFTRLHELITGLVGRFYQVTCQSVTEAESALAAFQAQHVFGEELKLAATGHRIAAVRLITNCRDARVLDRALQDACAERKRLLQMPYNRREQLAEWQASVAACEQQRRDAQTAKSGLHVAANELEGEWRLLDHRTRAWLLEQETLLNNDSAAAAVTERAAAAADGGGGGAGASDSAATIASDGGGGDGGAAASGPLPSQRVEDLTSQLVATRQFIRETQDLVARHPAPAPKEPG